MAQRKKQPGNTQFGKTCLGVCLAGMAIFLLASAAFGQSSQAPPNVLGMKIAQARKILEKKGYEIIEHPYSTSFHSRHQKVIAQRVGVPQTPGRVGASGSKLLFGSSGESKIVEVWYYDLNTRMRPRLPGAAKSQNPFLSDKKLIRVPVVMGLSWDQATFSIQRAGLRLVISNQWETTFTALDKTIALQRPMAGAMVQPDSTVSVTIYVHRGKARLNQTPIISPIPPIIELKKEPKTE